MSSDSQVFAEVLHDCHPMVFGVSSTISSCSQFSGLATVNSKSQERCFLPKYGTDSGNDRFHVLKQFFWYDLKYPFLRHKNVELQFRPILESYQLQVASGSDQPNLFPLHYSSICLNIY